MKEVREPLEKAPFQKSTNTGQKKIFIFLILSVNRRASKIVSQVDCIYHVPHLHSVA